MQQELSEAQGELYPDASSVIKAVLQELPSGLSALERLDVKQATPEIYAVRLYERLGEEAVEFVVRIK